ncbi:protein of unknown function [Clostridium beijerinckii]|nr:protein of unknown function [Clostridium beijerinckii]
MKFEKYIPRICVGKYFNKINTLSYMNQNQVMKERNIYVSEKK